MGQYVVKLPDIGEGGTEAEIVAWHVKVGDTIREEDPLVDVMTDKATVESPAPVTGTIVALNGAIGEKRPVGSELVTLEVVGEGNVGAARPPLTNAALARRPSPVSETPLPSPATRERGDRSCERPMGESAAETSIMPRARQPGDQPLAP